MSRLASVVVLLSISLMGTMSPAEACAIWCLGSHGGHEHHMAATQGMSGHHHHAGRTHLDPVSSLSVGAGLCGTSCSSVVARPVRQSMPQERVKSLARVVLDAGVVERDGSVATHFEVAGPPGPACCGKFILRV